MLEPEAMTPEQRQCEWIRLHGLLGGRGIVVCSIINGNYWFNMGGITESSLNKRIHQMRDALNG